MWALLGAPGSAATFRAGEWPLEVAVTADQSSISLGEPTWLSFTVSNLSDEPLQLLVGGDDRNQLGRPGSFTVLVVGRDHQRVPQPDAGLGTGGLVGPQALPPKGSHVFRLFLPHWAMFAEAGAYAITCRRLLQVARPTTGREFLQQPTSDVLVEARTDLQVLPRDAARLGQLIRERGETMLREAGARGGDEAVIALAWIDDARVVPYFRGALKIPSYALKFVAVQVMGRFATDEACEGLKAAMAVTAADFSYAEEEKSPELAARIRHAAAGALGRSRHPAAVEFLVAHRRDESEHVRVAVVNAIARLPATRALPLLEEMARDRSPLVVEAARRHLGALKRTAETPKPK